MKIPSELSWYFWIVLFVIAIVFTFIRDKVQNSKNKDINQAVQLIRSNFGFLFERGFEVVNKMYDRQTFGNWIIVLRSKECIVRFIQDRNNMQMEIGPSWASSEISPSKGFVDIDLLLEYIENGRIISVTTKESQTDLNTQMQKLAAVFAAHYDELLTFVNRDDFSEELEKIKSLFTNELRKRYPNIQ